jgi:hypothetical protein
MADFTMKMRWSAILLVNVVVHVFIQLREKPVCHHVQEVLGTVLSVKKTRL